MASAPDRRTLIESRAGRLALTALLLAVAGGCSAAVPGTPTAEDAARELARFLPSEDNRDPSKGIEGVVITHYRAAHTEPGRRVAYEKAPPDGGRHDGVWADCNGTVYPTAVRNEHMVHSLEHGAVWIAYDPETVTGGDLDQLVARVDGNPYLMLSPYPGLDQPISLQAWGHQLKLSDPADPRIDRFVRALRTNAYTSPEPGARCDTQGTGFDVADPPPFDPSPPGPDAAPVAGS